jgi:hypothetical protein
MLPAACCSCAPRDHPAARQLAGPFPGDGPLLHQQQQQQRIAKHASTALDSCTAAAIAEQQQVAAAPSPGRSRGIMWENDPLLDEKIR